MGWHFLRVVDERTNVASSYENQLVCTLVDRPFGFLFKKVKILAKKRKIILLYLLPTSRPFCENEISNQPTARLSGGKLCCHWVIMLVTMATPISSLVKDK